MRTSESEPADERLPRVLDDGLAVMRPGLASFTALSGVDFATLGIDDLSVAGPALIALRAHLDAQLMACVVQLGGADWDSQHLDRVYDQHSAEQVGLVLGWDAAYAEAMLELYREVVVRLPMVHQALSAGRVGYGHAVAFAEALRCLADDEAARKIAGEVLATVLRRAPAAPADVRRWINDRLHRRFPEAVKRRQQEGVRRRSVHLGAADDGTGYLQASGLPIHRAAAVDDFLDRVARAAKADGDERTLAQLRVDTLLDAASGLPVGVRPSRDAFTATADHVEADPAADDEVTTSWKDGGEPIGRVELTPEQAYRLLVTGGTHPGALYAALHPDAVVSAPPESEGAGVGEVPLPGTARPRGAAPRRGNVDIVLSLSTLMGLNDNPGACDGFGPVIADIARQVAFDQATNPRWRFLLTDEHSSLLMTGIVTARASLVADPGGGLAPRFLTAHDEALVRARDRTCRVPGCRRKAIRCDIDHRHDHALGGASSPENACCLCKRHHRLKTRKKLKILAFGRTGFFIVTPDGRLYFSAPDDTLTMLADHPGTDGGYDLDECDPRAAYLVRAG